MLCVYQYYVMSGSFSVGIYVCEQHIPALNLIVYVDMYVHIEYMVR